MKNTWKNIFAFTAGLTLFFLIAAVSIPNAPYQKFRDGLAADSFYKIDGGFAFYATDVAAVTNATSANTANTIVKRGASGEFSAGQITANITGNVSGSSGSCTGNAATATNATTVTNGIYSTGNYSDPSWLTLSSSKVGLSAVANALQLYRNGSDFAGIVQGAIFYYDGAIWGFLPPGDSGKFLKTQGASANPIWDSPTGSGDVIAPASHSASYFPRWNTSANSKTLVEGVSGAESATPSTVVLRDVNASITAQAFYGDGSHLSNISTGSGDVTGPVATTENYVPLWDSITKKLKDGFALLTTATADSIVKRDTNASITAQAFYGDGSHLTGVSSGGASAPVALTSNTTITSSHKNILVTNAGATGDVTYTLSPIAELGDDFGFEVVNEVGTVDGASGGTVYYDNGYVIHVFTSSGTFIAQSTINAEVLVVAGGGGGGGGKYSGGGGGAGGLIYNSAFTITANSHTITIGNGGAGGVGQGVSGTNGQNTTFSTLTAIGGGGGASRVTNAGNGGSGGGHGGGTATNGTGTSGQGYNGGVVGTNSGVGGGGGGAGGVGGNVNPNGTVPTMGGAGLQFTQFASFGGYPAGWFASGGGGAADGGAGAYSTAVNGGGGRGSGGDGEDGVANTGGGGGGAERAQTFTGGTGGSGIVIIRYQDTSSRITITPATGERLPGTSAINQSLTLSAKGDFTTIRNTGSNLIGKTIYPAQDAILVTGPSSTTENYVPLWDSMSRLLKNGLQALTTATANALVKRDASASIYAQAFYGDGSHLTGNISGSSCSCTGNAATATKLAATKTINGVAFDGSANITVPSDIAPGTSGNVLTSNGSAWTSATPSSGGGISRWTEITGFTATPASTSTLTFTTDRTTVLKAGIPVRYTISSVIYYGKITACTSNLLTIAGAQMGGDVTKLEYGVPEQVVVVNFFVSGNYGDGVADLLAADMNTYFRWQQSKAYLVAFSCTEKTVDTGTEPKVNVKVNGTAVSTNDTNLGVQLTTAGTWVDNSAVAINTTYYDINPNEAVEITCTAAGGTGDAAYLTVQTTFVLE